MDEFFRMGHWGDILRGLKMQKGFCGTMPTSFSEMKATYGSVFQGLLTCTSSVKALGLLLSLVQMMFFFIAAYFPSFLSFSGSESSS
jgi:hypothetical protein